VIVVNYLFFFLFSLLRFVAQLLLV